MDFQFTLLIPAQLLVGGELAGDEWGCNCVGSGDYHPLQDGPISTPLQQANPTCAILIHLSPIAVTQLVVYTQ